MNNKTTPIIAQIEELVSDVPGWTPIDQLYTLFGLIYASAGIPGDIVEIGSWCGRSTIVLALAARMTGVKAVHCVDLFPEKQDWALTEEGHHYFKVKIGDSEHEGYKGFGGVWQEPFTKDIAPLYEKHGSVYGIFQNTISRKGFADIVKVHRGTSSMFAGSAGDVFRCKFAFIDGDHSYQPVCDDFRNMDRFLVPGGWLAFDDAFSVYEGVDRAISENVTSNPAYDLSQQMARKLFVARKRPTLTAGTVASP
jgi:predicted O-methyltransferase YrrM